MVRRRTRTWWAATGLLILAATLTGVVLWLGLRSSKLPVENPPAQGSEPLLTRRLPVAGSPGFVVIVHPDGRSELETPTGREALLDATPTSDAAARQAAVDLARRIRPETKTALTQVIVLDQGVVDVPADAIVTFTAPDRAVAVLRDGSTSVYYADGRVQRRELRQPKLPPALPPE